MQRIPKEQVQALMAEIKGLRTRASEMIKAAHVGQAAAADIELFVRANCDHEWGKMIQGYEHEGPSCIHCGLMQLHQRLVEVGYEAKAETKASSGDQANKSSTD